MKSLRILICLLSLSTVVFAEQLPLAIVSGTAGAGVSTVRGGDARWVNPALLGLSDNPKQSALLPSFGYRIGNDALKTSQLNTWFKKNRYWTKDERNTMVNSLSGDFTMLGQAGGGLGYQFQNFIFAVDGVGMMDAGLPKNVLNMMVNGNQPGARYDLSGIRGGGWAGLSFGATFAKEFKDVSFAQEFSAGITAKYIVGLSYAGIRSSSGSILTNIQPDTVSLHGNIVTATASQGDGVAFDVGFAGREDENWGWSLAFLNVAGKITWSNPKVHSNSFGVDTNGIPVDSLTKEGFLERWTNYKSDNYGESGSTENRLPPVMLAGADYRYDKEWTFLGSVEQGLSTDKTMIGGTDKTKWAFGAEYNHFAMIPLRSGFAVGGESLFEFQVGAGYHSNDYQIDIASGFTRGFFNGAKGFTVSISQRVIIE